MKKRTVLIVDDVYFMRNLLKKELKEAGYEVVGEAKNGKEGIKLYFDLKPDLVTMDIKMPDMNGIEVTKQILSKDPHARILAVSGNNKEDIKQEILKAGALDYLQKPFQPAFLWNKLDKIFDADHSVEVTKEDAAPSVESFVSKGVVVSSEEDIEDDFLQEFELPSEPDPVKSQTLDIKNEEDAIVFPESYLEEEEDTIQKHQLVVEEEPEPEEDLSLEFENPAPPNADIFHKEISPPAPKSFERRKEEAFETPAYVPPEAPSCSPEPDPHEEEPKPWESKGGISIRPPRGKAFQNALYEQDDDDEVDEPILNYEDLVSNDESKGFLKKIKTLFGK